MHDGRETYSGMPWFRIQKAPFSSRSADRIVSLQRTSEAISMPTAGAPRDRGPAGRQAGRQAAAAKLTHTSSGGGAEEESSSAKSTRGRLILCTVDRGVIGHWALHMHSGNGQPPAANGATNGALLAFGDLIQYCILVSFAHFQSDPTAAVPNSKIQPNKLS
jgi:hypothetical protein